MSQTYDVAVVGAGVLGAWVALELTQEGKRVVLLDAYGPANTRASSGGESRIIRAGYGPDELYTRMSLRSLRKWQEFVESVQKPLLHRTGVLWMCYQGEDYAEKTVRTLEKAHVQFERLSRQELEKRYPQFAFDGVDWGTLEPASGVVMARRAVAAVVEEAVRRGAKYFQEAVRAPSGGHRASSLETSNNGHVAAESFVFACGPWLPKLFPAVLGDRIFPTRQEVFFFGLPPGDARFRSPALPTWIHLAEEIYGMPDLESRGLKIALDRHGPLIDPDTVSRVPSAESLEGVGKYVARRFPALKSAPVVESRVCQYENTSNGDFLIDRHPEWENVWLVGGGSGHAFKHGPVVAEYVVAQIEGRGAAEPRFSLAAKQSVQNRTVY